MACTRFEDVAALSDGLLKGEQEDQALAHMLDCAECRETYVEIRRASAVLATPVAANEAELAGRVIRQITGRQGTGRRASRTVYREASIKPIWIGIASGVAAAVIMFLTLALLSSKPGTRQDPRKDYVREESPVPEAPAPKEEAPRVVKKHVPQIIPEPIPEPKIVKWEDPVEEIPQVQPPWDDPRVPISPPPVEEYKEPLPAPPEAPGNTEVALRPAFVARVCNLDGKVVTEGQPKGLNIGDTISWEDPIRTGPKSTLSLRLPDGGWVYMKPSSKIQFDYDTFGDGGTVADLEQGTVFFELPKQKAPFRVLAGPERAYIVGTSFSITRDEKETTLIVESGRVRFMNPLGQIVVNGGFQSVAKRDQWPSQPKRVDTDKAFRWVRDLSAVIVYEDFNGVVKLERDWRFVEEAEMTRPRRLSKQILKISNPDDKVRVAGLLTKEAMTLTSPIRIRARLRADRFSEVMSLNVGFARATHMGLSYDLWRWSRKAEHEILRTNLPGHRFRMHWGTDKKLMQPGEWRTIEVTINKNLIWLRIDGKLRDKSLLPSPIRGAVQAGIWVYVGGQETVEIEIDEITVERLR